jgi:hypothetical protein
VGGKQLGSGFSTRVGPTVTLRRQVTLDLILIGIAVALDPLPLTAFFVLLPSNRGVRKGAAYVFGWLVSLAVVVAITVVATGDKPPKPSTGPSIVALAVKIAIGVVLVVVGANRYRKYGQPKPPKKTPKWQTGVDKMSPWFAMGLAPTLQPWGLIAAGAATVTAAKVSSVASYIALFAFCLIGSSSYLAIELYAIFRFDKTQALLKRIRTWIDGHTDQLIIGGSLLLGLWLIGKSAYLLVT